MNLTLWYRSVTRRSLWHGRSAVQGPWCDAASHMARWRFKIETFCPAAVFIRRNTFRPIATIGTMVTVAAVGELDREELTDRPVFTSEAMYSMRFSESA
jgi:transposase